MTFQQIRYFLVLAEELHFWKTAEKVYTSQSALSRQIQSLEEELEVKLFDRDKRNVKLTAAGTFLQRHWKVLIADFDRTHRQAKKINEGTSGLVSIAYPGSISFSFLPDLVKVLNDHIPDLKIELTEPTDQNHEKLLLSHQIDIAFSRDRILNPSIDSVKLYSESMYLVVPEDHWIDEHSFTDIRDVQEENFIISGLHHTTVFASLLRNLFKQYGIKPKTTIESDFGGMILNLVSKGLGISILPHSFQFAAHNKVRFIEINENVDLYINWHNHDPSKIIKNIVEYSEVLGKKL